MHVLYEKVRTGSLKYVCAVMLQCTSGRSDAAKTITAKVVPCASTSSAHAQPVIDLSPATPNVPNREVDTVAPQSTLCIILTSDVNQLNINGMFVVGQRRTRFQNRYESLIIIIIIII